MRGAISDGRPYRDTWVKFIEAEANLARGEAHRWKPGQSGNPGGRLRTARGVSEACRAKLASDIPGDAEGRQSSNAAPQCVNTPSPNNRHRKTTLGTKNLSGEI